MVKVARWIFALLPCGPGVVLLSAAAIFDGRDPDRAFPLYLAGSIVFLAGVVIAAFIVWRIGHPRPDVPEERGQAAADLRDGPPPYSD